MREIRPCGFVRGVLGNWHPYRGSQILLRDSRGKQLSGATHHFE